MWNRYWSFMPPKYIGDVNVVIEYRMLSYSYTKSKHLNRDIKSNMNEYKDLVEPLLEEILKLTDRYLPNKGDTCEFSQKICIRQAIAKVHYCINGLEDTDFIDNITKEFNYIP